MGILNFFSQQTEERLHQHIAQIINEYHQLKALLERQKAVSEHINHIHKRIDAINSALRSANAMPPGEAKMHYLHQLVQSEKHLLEAQKKLASNLEYCARKAEHIEKRTAASARRIRSA